MDTSTYTVEALILDLLEWVDLANRTYEETIEAWRTSCPRLPVWEEANDRRLIVLENVGATCLVHLTPEGRAFLNERRARQGINMTGASQNAAF
jgi:D-3-phosphoglycerate dehydrogenase